MRSTRSSQPSVAPKDDAIRASAGQFTEAPRLTAAVYGSESKVFSTLPDGNGFPSERDPGTDQPDVVSASRRIT